MPKLRYTAIMEAEKTTQNKVRLVNQDCLGENSVPLSRHPMTYLYIGKDLFTQLGGHAVYEVTITPIIPE